MPSVEHGQFGRQPTAVNRKKHLLNEPKKRKPRQEICAPLKWLCFIANFLVFVSLNFFTKHFYTNHNASPFNQL